MPVVPFNMVGPQGPQGDIGPTGDTGATGPKGDPGSLTIVTDGTNTDNTLPGTLKFGPGFIVTPDNPDAASVLVGLVFGSSANTVVAGDVYAALNAAYTAHSASTVQHGATGAVVGTTNTQTLTNKTLTSPTISGPTLSGTIAGTYTIGGTPTFPATVVTTAAAQTLTNKTLTSPVISSIVNGAATLTLPTVPDTLVGRAVAETLTNKTMSGTNNTFTNLPGANVVGTVPIGSLPTGTTSATLSTGDRGLPTGGVAGDVLKKNSATNYDASFVTPPVTPTPVTATDATTRTHNGAGTTTTLTGSITIPAGTWLVRNDVWMEGEGVANTLDAKLSASISVVDSFSPTWRWEQGVNDNKYASFARVITVGVSTALSCTAKIQWVAGAGSTYGTLMMLTAVPA